MLTASKIRTLRSILCFLFFLFSFFSNAQTPGLIVRPTTGPNAVLDYNKDGFTSVSSNGFGANDVGTENSEIPFKVVPPFKLEPTADLMRGPNDRFTDLVRISDTESGMYVFNDGTNMLFRLRLGEIVPGSKGYSILIDADGLFGASGPYADPNYKPATTGINGNPGFEIEVVLETNFRVAIYDVDGKDDAGNNPVSTYTINTNSQISIAASLVSGTPDYLYDFYVPLADLKYANGSKSVTASTPIRISSTTVMSPQAAIGGPKSDIYGYDGTDYMKAWETVINGQPSFTPDAVKSTGNGIVSTICTAAPTLNTPISTGTVTISGKWIQADASKSSSATITLYKNGSSIGTKTVSTGETWRFDGVLVAKDDVFFAKAQASSESACLQSNSFKVQGCVPAQITNSPTFSCISAKGTYGIKPANSTVKLYRLEGANLVELTPIVYNTNDATYWGYDGKGTSSAGDLCKGGAGSIIDGQYILTATEIGKCESQPVYQCLAPNNSQSTPPPLVTQTELYPFNTDISGTATNGHVIRLYRNGILEGSPQTVTSAGTFSFTNLVLSLGDKIEVTAQGLSSTSGGKTTYPCVGVTTRNVTCFAVAPTITTVNGNLIVGATTITGTSTEPAGTIISVFNSNNIQVGSNAQVLPDGTWNVAIANGLAATGYYAKAQNGTCSPSIASTTVTALSAASSICPTFDAGSYIESSNPITINGRLASAFSGTIRLYLDGNQIGSQMINNETTWSIVVNNNNTASINNNMLYPGGKLTVTSQASNSVENTGCSASVTVACTLPSNTFTVNPSGISTFNPAFVSASTMTFTVAGSEKDILYTLEDAEGVDKAVSKFGNGGTITFTGVFMPTVVSSNIWRVKALRIGSESCSSVNKLIYLSVTDNDSDGIADYSDLDDDNDGIIDTNETATYDATGDEDSDGVPNYKDILPGGTGMPNSDLNNDGIVDFYDTDRDGIINQFDLDSDNDGIPDVVENGGSDSNNDGKVDVSGVADTDNDGLGDAVDASKTTGANGSIGLSLRDFDGDGIPNFKDLDSDGDGILDAREANVPDSDHDGVVDGVSVGGADTNGWSNVLDGTGGGTALNIPNFDTDGKPNYLDIDADDDGITDNVEGQASLPDPGAYVAPADNDADKDGIDDAYDNDDVVFGGNIDNGIEPINTNNDNEPDYMDLDSDGDNDKDIIEGNDLNRNGKADDDAKLSNADTDGDGLDDFFEADVNNGPVVTIAGFTNGTAGGKSPAQRTAGALGVNRDWRNRDFSLTVNTVLPVQFVSFIATKQSNGVQLTWNVTAEENVKNYEVEKSTDGRSFSKAGQVPYKASSNVINKYQFFDATIPASITFYRIRQVDLDSKFMYSGVVTVIMGEGASKLSVHPNPVQSQASIVLGVKSNQKTILMVSDMQGRILNRRNVELQKGQNVITADKFTQLQEGTYILMAEVNGLLLQTKFTKQ